MPDSLFQAYLPLFFWSGIGIVLCRFVPSSFPKLLGRSLYWVGVPLEIFALARQTRWATEVSLAPLLTVSAVLIGMGLAWLVVRWLLWLAQPTPKVNPNPADAEPSETVDVTPTNPYGFQPENFSSTADLAAPRWSNRAHQGSFILASMLGNTGFVGLAVAPAFVSESHLSWLILYSVTQNVFGTYGIGVFLASYFGRPSETNHWWMQLRDVLTVPSLWAFVTGSLTQPIALPELLETGLHNSVWVIIPMALLLMGIRLSQLRGWQSLQMGIVPSVLKSIAVPGLVGGLASLLQIPSDARLAIVLMAGMPTAFAGLILAEEYELDRELIASSIVLTSGLLVATIPVWLLVFGGK
jgi:malate permease and related proteins